MNQIKMIGIDHSKATVEYRELFSFTKAGAGHAMEALKEKKGIDGVIILSTCNRMELWVSAHADMELSLYDELCRLKQVNSQEYRDLFTEREGDEAIRHLFETACGLKSKIIGDDQIITQVKSALTLSREVFCTDKVLETLFRTAVSAGKKVKTEVKLTGNDTSAITGAIQSLKAQGIRLGEMTCMVIGNGEMGRLAATALIQEGADVTVTVRQYHNGQVQIPKNCSRINYGDRMEYLKYCDLVVSATASPNCTIKYSEITQVPRKENVIMIDLAVPRDIDQAVGKLDGITLYDIDSFGLEMEHEQLKAATAEAEVILQEFINDFNLWYGCMDLVPLVQKVCSQAAQDVGLRLTKPMKKLDASETDKVEMEKAIETAASKVVNKILFGLRDNLNISTWRECMEAVAQIYEIEE
ncbi:MAG: glutamyl-tRNA reductase [Lachnospiraceae bacterium]|nr:glutamyl-tRNA reductase [Lachnospiraceae bacterium]